MLRRGMMAGGTSVGTSDFAFDPATKNASVVLSNSDKTATVGNVSDYKYALCLPTKDSGKWIYEFDIVSMPPSTGFVSVGLASKPPLSATTGTSYASTDAFMWMVRKSGALVRFYYNATSYDGLSSATQSFDAGDIVTITVDFATKEVNIYRNGTLIYTKTVVVLDASLYDYAPCVKLWGTSTGNAAVTCRSTIAHPVSGFTPWA